MPALKEMKDNQYDLAIVDPPYGIGMDGGQLGYSKHPQKGWDKQIPPEEYFKQLNRVSKNQIIWGFNHFLNRLEPTKAVIFWNKHQNGYFAEGELAWCSTGTVKYVDRPYQRDIGNKIHPTQKPIYLYEWLLMNYAKEGNKILDTHGGSMSIAIACHNLGFDLDLYEIDKEYFDAGKKRLEQHKSQLQLWQP
jgi:site-specific DNA-methyltransferase (adenine-specific)